MKKREKYLKRAEQEWNVRKETPGSTLENKEYNQEHIIEDVRKQLLRYAQADSGEDVELKQFISSSYRGLNSSGFCIILALIS